MDTSALKKFAQDTRRQLLDQVAVRMEQVLSTDSVEIREKEKAVKELREQIRSSSKEAVINRVAYIWFNRFCALRYMDVNHYTRMGIVSPVEDFTQPEILQEAKQGVIDGSFKVDKQRVFDLLNGQLPASNPQQEAYRLLLVGACNAYHAQMPFLFPKIEDYTELLMPDDLLSENSILHTVRSALDEDACQDVEVIGWLYQFYISERKDEVFAALKENKKIEAEDIPAATQLFTPHWIVRYLVENSLGRLWMLNHPQSKLVEQMDYYIKPEEPESEFLEITSPEEIKVCDPACGSGHMLTYAFDLLYAIYEEQGYDPVQIPSLIFQHNLYGIEIDKRAGDLAAFALVMKARAKDRRFFRRKVDPNICVLENITFSPSELNAYRMKVGHDLFTQDLWFLLGQFEQADNFGSLIRPQVQHPEQMLERLDELGAFDDLLLYSTNEKVKRVLMQAKYLSPHYHVVVANPPYMGRRGMNSELREFADDNFPNSKSDIFAMFIERDLEIVITKGFVGMITMQSWMFLSSYQKLRESIFNQHTIVSMAHLGTKSFDTIGGEVVSTTAFVLSNSRNPDFAGRYFRLVEGNNENEKNILLKNSVSSQNKADSDNIFHASVNDFNKIPGSPVAYWINKSTIKLFDNPRLENITISDGQNKTGNNERFLRKWWEVEKQKIGIQNKWLFYAKGGGFRRWAGNIDDVINWSEKARKHYRKDKVARILPEYLWYKPGITWGLVTSTDPSFRLLPKDATFDVGGSSVFPKKDKEINYILALVNSKIASFLLRVFNPTMNYQVKNIRDLPFFTLDEKEQVVNIVKDSLKISEGDWNLFETSRGFSTNPLHESKILNSLITDTYKELREDWKILTKQLHHYENIMNTLFVESQNLQDEIEAETLVDEISLLTNPNYRYPNSTKKFYSNREREAMLLEDTIKEFISYAVGCMLGRYSLDKPGLIMANAGEMLEDYLGQVPEPSFVPDKDNVIPVLEGEWFEDDIAGRFKDFLKVTFGEENFEENIAFLEGAIGRDIRTYFVKDFYKEHVKMYKKRPIYWLFSSPKGSFNALIYMHRYRSDTLSVILNDYLVQYREKLTAHKALLETRSISASASQGEKTKAVKEIDQINKVLSELKEYEDEILYLLATQQIEIDLDDGVKVNYKKFGKALKKVAGLSE